MADLSDVVIETAAAEPGPLSSGVQPQDGAPGGEGTDVGGELSTAKWVWGAEGDTKYTSNYATTQGAPAADASKPATQTTPSLPIDGMPEGGMARQLSELSVPPTPRGRCRGQCASPS